MDQGPAHHTKRTNIANNARIDHYSSLIAHTILLVGYTIYEICSFNFRNTKKLNDHIVLLVFLFTNYLDLLINIMRYSLSIVSKNNIDKKLK